MSEKKEDMKMKERDMEIRRIWVDPTFEGDCGCTDDEDVLELHYEIPGVQKEKIHLHIADKYVRLSAPKDKRNVFVNSFSLSCPADVPGVIAKYHDGVLDVQIPYSCPNPFKDVSPIKIQ